MTTDATITVDEVPWFTERRNAVAARLARAEAADPDTRDPIMHRLDEYRACIAELDDLIARAVDNTAPLTLFGGA